MLCGRISRFRSIENNTVVRENKWNAYHVNGAYYCYITCVKHNKVFTSTWKNEYYVRLVIFTWPITLLSLLSIQNYLCNSGKFTNRMLVLLVYGSFGSTCNLCFCLALYMSVNPVSDRSCCSFPMERSMDACCREIPSAWNEYGKHKYALQKSS
jgi:hypothetical protein